MTKRTPAYNEDPLATTVRVECASIKAPENVVDEASEESFPASDAPAWNTCVKNTDHSKADFEEHFLCHQCGKHTNVSTEHVVKGQNCFIHFCSKLCYDRWRIG